MMTTVAGILIVIGAVFTLLAGVGVVRFDDVYSRLHPAAKGPTLGLLLVALGAVVELRNAAATAALVLVVVLQFLAAPVGSHLLGRAIHARLPLDVDEIDELARDQAADAARAADEGGTTDRPAGGA